MPCSKCFYPTDKLTPIADGRQLCDLCLNARIVQLDDRPTNDLRGSIMYAANAILDELRKTAPRPEPIAYLGDPQDAIKYAEAIRQQQGD